MIHRKTAGDLRVADKHTPSHIPKQLNFYGIKSEVIHGPITYIVGLCTAIKRITAGYQDQSIAVKLSASTF